MTASKHLRIDEVLALLQRLRTLAREFGNRETALEKDARLRAGQLRRTREQDLETLEATLTTERDAAEAGWREAEAALEASLARRRSAIARAREGCLRGALEQADRTEGNRKFQLQTHMRDRERAYPEDRQAAEQAYADAQRSLQARRGEIVDLVQAVRQMTGGYAKLLQAPPAGAPEVDGAATFEQQFTELGQGLEEVQAGLRRIRHVPQAWLFRFLPLPMAVTLVLLIAFAALGVLFLLHAGRAGYGATGITAVILVVVLILLYVSGKRRVAPLAGATASAVDRVFNLHNACVELNRTEHDARLAALAAAFEQESVATQEAWQSTQFEAEEQRLSAEERVGAKLEAVLRKWEGVERRRRERFQRGRMAAARERVEQEERRRRQMAESHAAAAAALAAERDANWRGLVAEWTAGVAPLAATLQAAQLAAATDFPEWTSVDWANWVPPSAFPQAVTFGQADVDLEAFAPPLSRESHLALPEGLRLSVPLSVTFPQPGSLLLETGRKGREQALATLNTLIFRLLLTSRPGNITFTLLDPVELGQNFAGFMHLADHEKSLVNGRIWTQDRQIEQRLGDLNEHMEKVIQMYLRTEHRTLAEYNEKAGDLAEKYRFLVIADFPAGFSDLALGRLLSIAASGAKCGVYTLIHWDTRRALPSSFVLDELRRNSLCLKCQGDGFDIAGGIMPGLRLTLDAPPPPEVTVDLLRQIGRVSADAARIELGFNWVAPRDSEYWSLRTDDVLRVPIGRTGATRLQYFALGEGTRQHALIAGKTGSGKSNLLHVLITNLALWCSPREVEFYLIDFKKGVEFKCYATQRTPHARVVSIESDREFALSVLQRVDEELTQRGERYRQAGVQQFAAYRRVEGAEPLPRTLLIVDEFQEFFVEDDAVSQAAALLLDRLVRQGRAFGIHVLLGSQTLGGAYTVSRSTLGQMVVRIALQCNEADAFLIMDDSNSAPRMLSRPGEAIYNDAAGMLEGNSPFQVVWLPDEEREMRLAAVRRLADREPVARPGPLVFEGNAPAMLRANPLLEAQLSAERAQPVAVPRAWIGAPNSIKGPTEISFPRQNGSHLLVVGQQEEAQVTLFAAILAALAAQHGVNRARFLLLDATPPGTPSREFLERVARALPHRVDLPGGAQLAEALADVAAEIERRHDVERVDELPAIFVLINGIQRFPKLRYGDGLDFSFGDDKASANPAVHLNQLIHNGGGLGCHVMISCDTYSNANRFLGRKGLAECTMRVLFQMSASDSASLIDNPVAGGLGLHRAVLYNEQAGYTEIFRPYALPDPAWVRELAENLARLHGPRPAAST
ncbi:MAG: ATP-binding protein [Lentisphaerae bacterium]|nr:ATP-binding protein [Lentisphaerota bacterium]